MISLREVMITHPGIRLENLTLEVPTGTCAILMGPNGSGKTTLFEAIVGLQLIQQGGLWIHGIELTNTPSQYRGIGYMPQDLALFPIMTVRNHLRFPLEIHNYPEKKILARVDELAKLLRLEPLLDRLPEKLSGGEAQRVALGRAIAAFPEVVLLDEPFSSMDSEGRREMVQILRKLRTEWKVTLFCIHHNLTEAREISETIYHIKDGKIDKIT